MSRPGPRVGLFGILGSGNWGNDVSLDVVVRALRERVPEARIDFMAMGPARLEETYGAPAVWLQWYEGHANRYRWAPSALLKAIGRLLDVVRTWRWVRGHDVVIVPGAGVLETTTPKRPWAFPLSLLTLAIVGRLTRTRIAFVCVGANVAANPIIRRELAWAVRLASYRSYRDELSREAVCAMGFANALGDPVYPDLFYAAEVPGRRPPERPIVGLGLMNYHGAEADRSRAAELHSAYVDAVLGLVDRLVAEGWQVRLFTGDQEDEAVVDRVIEHVRGSADPDQVQRQVVASMGELLDVLAGVDVAVASRYHNVLGALRMGVPTLSISYAAKSDAAMAAMGLGEFCHPADGIDLDRLMTRFQTLVERGAEFAAAMPALDLRFAEATERQLDELTDFVRSGHSSPVTADH